MQFRNFKTLTDRSSITKDQIYFLLNQETAAQEKGKEIHVCMISNDFEGEKKNKIAVITPIDFKDNKTGKHFKYDAHFLGTNACGTTCLDGVCGMYMELEEAYFELDHLYGANTEKELARRKSEIAPRLETVENYWLSQQKSH